MNTTPTSDVSAPAPVAAQTNAPAPAASAAIPTQKTKPAKQRFGKKAVAAPAAAPATAAKP